MTEIDVTIRSRGELEDGPQDMTEAEVAHHFPGALEAVGPLLQGVARSLVLYPRRYRCDDMDLHLTVTVDAEADRYSSWSWRPSRAKWVFSF